MQESKRVMDRELRIHNITEVLRREKAGDLKIDYEKFWIEIAAKYHCSERKAKEYIKIAKFMLK